MEKRYAKHLLKHCNLKKSSNINAIQTILNKLPENEFNDFRFGTTKAVIDTNKNFVIKIPFLEIGDVSVLNKNYIEEEIELYEGIKDECSWIAELFAPNVFLCKIRNHPIYIQEKCIPLMEFYNKNEGRYFDAEENFSKIYDVLNSTRYYPEDESLISPLFLYEILCEYGESGLKDFCHILETFCISDLIDSNVGFTAEGKPILFDYGGVEDTYNSYHSWS